MSHLVHCSSSLYIAISTYAQQLVSILLNYRLSIIHAIRVSVFNNPVYCLNKFENIAEPKLKTLNFDLIIKQIRSNKNIVVICRSKKTI